MTRCIIFAIGMLFMSCAVEKKQEEFLFDVNDYRLQDDFELKMNRWFINFHKMQDAGYKYAEADRISLEKAFLSTKLN